MVGIGDAEPIEHLGLQRFHRLGLLVALMVEAEEMQHAVHREMGGVTGGRNISVGSLGENCLGGKHDIAERTRLACSCARTVAGGKRQHVGGGVLAAPFGAWIAKKVNPDLILSFVGAILTLTSGYALYRALS